MSQPQPPSGPPVWPQYDAAIKFTVQGSVLTSNLVPPTLTIDGHPAPSASGGSSTVIPVPSGTHHLEAYSQWLRSYGQAALDVQIPPQSQVEVFYAPPYHQFTGGAMGVTPQPRKGMGCLVGIFAGLLVIVLLIVILAVVAG